MECQSYAKQCIYTPGWCTCKCEHVHTQTRGYKCIFFKQIHLTTGSKQLPGVIPDVKSNFFFLTLKYQNIQYIYIYPATCNICQVFWDRGCEFVDSSTTSQYPQWRVEMQQLSTNHMAMYTNTPGGCTCKCKHVRTHTRGYKCIFFKQRHLT